MRVLALDTTTAAGSVALVDDDRVIAERAGDPSRPHAERLPRDIESILADGGMRSADVDLFAVAAGPGSFTGLRIGIATIQGFAFVHRRQVAAVSALEALAAVAGASRDPGTLVGAWMDAHRRDVFSALYRIAGPSAIGEPSTSLRASEVFEPGGLIELEAAEVGAPSVAIDRWERLTSGEPIAFIGDGATLWAETLRARHPDAAILPHLLLAGAIGRLALRRAASGTTMDPADVRPLYVRRPDAEVARDARAVEAQNARG